jgi:hypothetical protein
MGFYFKEETLVGDKIMLAWEVDGSAYMQTFETGKPVTIGRHPQNDIILDRPSVSRYHGMLVVRDGVLKILNTSQSQLIKVIIDSNAQYLGYNESIRLDLGAEIYFDDAVIRILRTNS